MTGSTAGAGPALFRLVRFWSRRWAPTTAANAPGDTRHVQQVQVVEAIAASGAEVTVADVAYQLGLDRSVASRMVAEAIRSGHVDRGSSAADARRAHLTLTASGQAFLVAAHDFQQRMYEELVAGWDAADRERFGGYLRRLADEVTAPGQ
jgi:DNA-binding MarR family transcriptional regulator